METTMMPHTILQLAGDDLDPEDKSFDASKEQRHRPISEEQFRKLEGYAAEIFATCGLRLDTPSTKDTPRRFIRALFDMTAGYEGDPKLIKAFETECQGESACRLSQVIKGPIPFFALCEHHGLPFFGRAYVGYIAGKKIIGISKLTRLVRLFAQRFTVQERIGQQIVKRLDAMLEPHGAAVYLEARHLCVEMRGVRAISPTTRTSHWAGEYAEKAALRSDFFAACGLPPANQVFHEAVAVDIAGGAKVLTIGEEAL
jgi:GTP cyclohydrolase I